MGILRWRSHVALLEAIVFVASPVAFEACSGNNSIARVPPPDASLKGNEGSGGLGSTSGGTGTDTGTGSSGGAVIADDASGDDGSATDATVGVGGDGAVTGDAGVADTGVAAVEGGPPPASCQPPAGGAPCDPGMVACGGSSCTTSSSFCCVDGDGGACTPYNSAACPSGDLTVACDETADCTGGGVCCEEIVSLGVAGPTECMAGCPEGWFQVCRSNTECGDGDGGGLNRCVLQTCTQPPGLLTEGSSVVVEACAVPPSLGSFSTSGALEGCVAQ